MNPSQIQWFELPNHYVFHYVNAWEETNENGETIVKLFGCAQTQVHIELNKEHPFLGGEVDPVLSKFTFNLTTGESEWKVLEKDLPCEFPVIDQNLMGRKHKYAYLACF